MTFVRIRLRNACHLFYIKIHLPHIFYVVGNISKLFHHSVKKKKHQVATTKEKKKEKITFQEQTNRTEFWRENRKSCKLQTLFLSWVSIFHFVIFVMAFPLHLNAFLHMKWKRYCYPVSLPLSLFLINFGFYMHNGK